MFALSAYGMWGFFPIFYKLVGDFPPLFVVAHRIVWSVVFVTIFLTLVGRMGEVVRIIREPKNLGLLALSAATIASNWLVFVWAVGQSMVLDVSLGYFLNPLVSITIGLVVLREKLNRLQLIAVALVVVAVSVQGIMSGGLPWVSLVLGLSFAVYGYIRKITPVKATPGLLVETCLVAPIALGFLIWNWDVAVSGVAETDTFLFVVLMVSGPLTALPLVMFSASARRLPMIYIGLMQYIVPSMHFLLAVFLWNEPLDPTRQITFIIVWCALVVFTYDSVTRARKSRVVQTP